MDFVSPIEDSGGEAKCVVDVVTQLRQVDDDIKNMICCSINKMDEERNAREERIKSLDALVDAKEDELLFLSSKLTEMEDDLETKKGKIELLATKYTNIENEMLLYKEKLQFAENKNEEIMSKIEKMGTEDIEKMTNDFLVVHGENEENKKLIVLLQEQLNENKQNVKSNNDSAFVEHALNDKINTLQNDNKQLKDNLVTLSQDIIDSNKATEDNDKEALIKSLKATEALLYLQKTNCQKADSLVSELTLKLELEHDRRIRAQSVIDDLEKEKVLREDVLEKKIAECNQKDQQIAELIIGSNFNKEKLTKNLECVIEEKDTEILKVRDRANELAIKSDEYEELFMNQTEVAITLQSELQTSYAENKSLKKEMEMLNEMFEQMEHSIKVKEALDGQIYNCNEMEIYQDGKKVNVKVNELLELAAAENQDKLIQETCFNQVNTKNGTRMVVSVGKTFVKLRSLILEKKNLEEQLDQMKNINEHLCTQVNTHEQKLCNITEELNNTWFYVDKVKEQTRMLHNSETILRAELAEKRELLSKLRQELEESRASWNQVKLKNEDSERQWRSLKEDFAERRRMIWTPPASSESGFSEADTEALRNRTEGEGVTMPIDIENIDPLSLPVGTPEVVIASGIGAEFEDDDDDESIPDPFSDEEDDMLYVNLYGVDNNMISSTTTITNDMQNELDDEDDEEEEDYTDETIPLFIPSASYISQIPSQIQLPLFPSSKEEAEYQAVAEREGIDFTALNHCDDNVKDLINRMMCTSARSAFLATSLADLQRRITSGHQFCASDDDVDTDEEPRITEDDTGDDTESIEIESELGDLDNPPDNIPPPPPLPSFSLMPPTSHLTVRPTYEPGGYSDDDDEEDDGRRRNVQSPESSTAVTRFLIKHLPKQLSQLRNEKAVLEEKVRDLEALVMEQRGRMGEHERRADAEKNKAKKLEDLLSKDKQVPCLNSPNDHQVPVCIDEGGVLLTWTITSHRREEPSFVVFFSSKDGTETSEVPPLSTEVIPPRDEIEMIQTVLLTSCRNPGTYTLRVRGTTHGIPNVTLGFQMEKKSQGS